MVGSEHDAIAQIKNGRASNGEATNGPNCKRVTVVDYALAGCGDTVVDFSNTGLGDTVVDFPIHGHGAIARPTNTHEPIGDATRAAATAPCHDDIHAAVATKCIHELFEAQVDERPASTALVFRGERWSYQEVDERANQLARYLRARGVGPGSMVGVYFERSEKPIVSILATLKSGAAYVPIDSGYPAERVRSIVTEAEVAALLTEESLWDVAVEVCPERSIAVDTDARKIAAESRERVSRSETGGKPGDLAYVLFTSGTTGKPKGVMIEHRNVVGFAISLNKILKMGPADRVYQGFSLGFDASVEELWMAFTNGGALVVSPADVVRVPDEVVKLINENEITFISMVPTFLSILGTDMPTVRIVISGGEACPAEVIRRWSRPGRRVINTYGPTETTVDATFIECAVDEPVTIGVPLPAYSAYVLDENLQRVAPGEPGELCIGGVGVARGYLKRPELTAQKFVDNPFANGDGSSPRLYRSGDLVRMTADGQIDFLGRIDRQVKIRGFRIELSEIEAVLHDQPSIQQALVEVFERPDGMKELAAFVVPSEDFRDEAFDRDAVLFAIRDRVPAYMVPHYLDLIDAIPTLPSGKADRSRLPKPSCPLVSSSKTVVEPSNEVEQRIVDVWEKLLKLTPISCADDFFTDLGGHSLLAAEMASHLRSEHGFEVAIRDVYKYPTVQKLGVHISAAMTVEVAAAGAMKEVPARRSSREAIESVPRLIRWSCYSLQTLSIILGYGLASTPFMIFIMLVISVYQARIPLAVLITYTFVMSLLSLPLAIGLAIALKWLVIRRYKPGRYRLWGFYYFRWWLATRVQSVSGMMLFEGTPLMSLFYRLMGAKVGKNCIIDTSLCGVYDLITIGDDTCINSRTQLLGYRVEDGMLVIGSIEIGSRCYIGSHSCIGINTKMGDGSRLGDLSLLPDGAEIPAGESRRGSPAEPAEVVLPEITDEAAEFRNPLLFGMLYFMASEIIGDILMFTFFPPAVMVLVTYLHFGAGWAIAVAYLGLPINIVAFCLLIAAIKAMVMFRAKPGVYSVESWYCLRRWSVETIYRVAGGVMYTMYATIYLPVWLRLLGAKVGKHAELAMVGLLTPDLVEIGEGSFFADGSTVGGRRFYRGHMQLGVNRIGKRSFLGNSALLPIGSSIGDNSLLGVLSTSVRSEPSVIPDDTEWLGSPPFQLPRRPAVAGFDVSQTFNPTLKLYAQRCFFDAIRIMYPFYVGLTAFLAFAAYAVFGFLYLELWAVLLLMPLVSTLIALTSALSVYVVKKVMIGTYKPIIHPLWSTYVWRNEVLNGAYESIGAPIMSAMMGTPFYSWYLRLLGCKIGKHAFIQTTFISEFDLVEIGDYVALNFMSVVQNHLFEDRIMKSSYLKIGDECSVGNMSVVLYDTEMKQGSSIEPLSLLMKGETLPAHTRWIGLPTRQVRGPLPPPALPIVAVKRDPPKPARPAIRRRPFRIAAS